MRKTAGAEHPVNTLKRVWTSEHLRDLRWIWRAAMVPFAALVLHFIIPLLEPQINSQLIPVLQHYFQRTAAPQPAGSATQQAADDAVSTKDHPSLEWTMICGASAVVVALTGWAYQTASNRLGAIDLFGCEIGAICRVCYVADFARASVLWLKKEKEALRLGTPSSTEKKEFTSEENYTPVYDQRLSDLQPLSADVVTSVTEFYTYRKTMLDYLRKIADEAPHTETCFRLIRQMLYMQFLMYESGRKAVERLIDFEPNRAESLINIYCSELIAYKCLRDEYAASSLDANSGYAFVFGRLQLREDHYREAIPDLCRAIKEEPDENDKEYWLRAKMTVGDLEERYLSVFPGDADRFEEPRNPIVHAAPVPA